MAWIPIPATLPPAELPLSGSVWEQENARRLNGLALGLVALGLLWRFSRYLLRFPIWGDEAMLLVNYFTRDYLDLLGPIDNCQIAPILFHWIELTIVRFLGTDELLVRLPAFFVGLANIALFWRLAGLTLPPLGRTLAIGILSAAAWPATMCSLTKPYTFDLFFSLVFLWTALSWLRRPVRLTPLLVLAVVAPLAVLASYPSVFIGGAVSLTLALPIWRGRDWKAMTLFALFNILLTGTFVGHYRLVALAHLHSPLHAASTTAEGMHRFWHGAFPPLEPLRFVQWFVLVHTGEMAAYPVGSGKGSSSLTVLFVLLGVWHFYRHGRRGLLMLTAGAFGLAFLAALLHKYPYGTSCRVSQHLAPFYCLLGGMGVAVLIQRLQSAPNRWKATLGYCACLALYCVGGVAADVIRPYRDKDALWARTVINDLMARAGADPVLTAQDVKTVPPVFYWQLRKHGEQVISLPDVDWRRIGREHASLWVWSGCLPISKPQETSELQALLAQSGRRWRCVERTPSILVPVHPADALMHCRVYHWVREKEALPGSDDNNHEPHPTARKNTE